MTVGLAAIGGAPDSSTGQGTAMPLWVFARTEDARELFGTHAAAAGATALPVALLTTNGAATVIRNKYQREQ